MTVRTLAFKNRTAKHASHEFQISAEAIPHVMEWYGGYFGGDDYSVQVDGKKVKMDQSGWLVGDLP